MEKGGVSSSPAYIHLPGRHEVGTLSDPLEDPLQLGVDEGVVWIQKMRCLHMTEKKKLPTDPGTVKRVSAVVAGCTLNAEHLSYLERSPADLAQRVDYPLSISL